MARPCFTHTCGPNLYKNCNTQEQHDDCIDNVELYILTARNGIWNVA
jgi:hypothetical protein